ncbi:hypothetical protein H6F67_00375 [Microcoleus sp. FACHB-1515]|uniref:hypothetical protein n=1 Tax=Cyanophyceae TaxID=3028117 RepID=UPI001684F807|nr:hypothetical protein [Microcoleus sp. FACHB-1515]MBD2088331.1 hypothetical protein [Microcoleus sp. FACHB-1515]
MTTDPTDPADFVELSAAVWRERLDAIQQERQQLQQERLDRNLAEQTRKMTQEFERIQTFLWVQTLLLCATAGLVLSVIVTNRANVPVPTQSTAQPTPTQPEK